MILPILKMIAAAGTALTGLALAFRPEAAASFTGLEAANPRGRTEIRAIFGGVFIGLGVVALVLNNPVAYQMLGYTYQVTAAVRALGMIRDRSGDRSNYVSLVVEAGFGIVLVL